MMMICMSVLTVQIFTLKLQVVSWTLVTGLVSFIRLKITTLFRDQGGKSLVWVGAWTQIGSFVGAILSFVLVNMTSIFQSFDPCKGD